MWISHKLASFSHLLRRSDFDAIVDHLALTHITKSKAEPATIRIKKLLELNSSYSFRKNLDPNILPEKQHANPIKGSIEKPHIGQGRAGLRRKRISTINQTIIPPSGCVTENS